MLAEWISHNTVREFSLNDGEEHNVPPRDGKCQDELQRDGYRPSCSLNNGYKFCSHLCLSFDPVLSMQQSKVSCQQWRKKKKLIRESLGRHCEFKWVDSQHEKPSYFWSVRERREGLCKVISPWKPKGPPSTQNGPKAYNLEKPLEL